MISNKIILQKITNNKQINDIIDKKIQIKKKSLNNIKLPPLHKINKKKIIDCNNANEYLQQFYNISELYCIDDFNTKFNFIKKKLILENIFLIKTGWNLVYDNIYYLFDKAEEIICKKYNNIIEKRYKLYEKKYNLSRYKYNKNIMQLLYIKDLVSFVVISDYSICLGKISGKINIHINYINIKEKNIILNCFREIFFNIFYFDECSNILTIELKKIN